MGQKTHPKGFRLGIIRDWDSRWYARRQEFVDLLLEDHKIRQHIKKRLYDAGISRVEIERAANDNLTAAGRVRHYFTDWR